MNKCLLCQNYCKTTQNRYCSIECAHKARIGIKRPEHALKMALKLKGHFVSEETKNKIREKNTHILSNEEVQELTELFSLGYIRHYEAVKSHLSFFISERVFNRYKKEICKNYNCLLFLNIEIQKWPKEKWFKLINELKTRVTTNVIREWNLSEKTILRILKFYNLKRKCKPPGYTGESKPERYVREFLEKENIQFEQEYNLGKFYFDFKIQNKFIEVQGDFWHCNPKIYDKPIAKIQKDNLINDSFKLNFAQLMGFQVIYIWEYDLKHNRKNSLKELLEKISE